MPQTLRAIKACPARCGRTARADASRPDDPRRVRRVHRGHTPAITSTIRRRFHRGSDTHRRHRSVHAPKLSEASLEFTGERVVLGRSDHAAEEYELEHVSRYIFARAYARDRFVVDVACGTGYGSAILAEAGATLVHGYDVDPASIEFASREWAGPGVSFAVADACLLPEGDATVDAVVTFETIEHLPDPSAFVGEIARILREGGVFAACDCDWPPTMRWEAQAAYGSSVDLASGGSEAVLAGWTVQDLGNGEHE